MVSLDVSAALNAAYNGLPWEEIAEAAGCSYRELWTRRREDALFDQALADARDAGLELRADSLYTLGEDPETDINRARLLSDNIKWLLARRKRKDYGDRVDVDVRQVVDISLALTEARRRIPGHQTDLVEDVTPRPLLPVPNPFD